jgi:hypothetical protein
MRRFFESLDLFDKFSEEEYRVRTVSGAIISLCLMLVSSLFFFMQLHDFLIPDLRRDLFVNKSTPGLTAYVNISMSITVHFPCHFLHVDSGDVLGFSQTYANTVTLRRYSQNLSYLGNAEYPNRTGCASCFNVRPGSECCNSCEELYLLSKLKGQTPDPKSWPQCEGITTFPDLDEICLLKGKLTVNRVPGEFRVAFSRSLYLHGEFEFPNFNLSHSVERLRFGLKLPTAATPLDSVLVVQQDHLPMHYHYGITCTGIVFESDGVPLERGYEYGVVATASIASSDTLLTPGLYFQYAFTPYTIRVAYLSKPISGWMTSTFGILSGGFAIALMLDGLFYGEKSQRVID